MGVTRSGKGGGARILIVGDHPIIREALCELIRDEGGMSVIGEASDGEEMLNKAEALAPNLVIMDFNAGRQKGIYSIRKLTQAPLSQRVLVFSKENELVLAERVIRAGAKGYVQQNINVSEIMPIVQAVLAGEVYLGRRVRDRVIGRVAREGKRVSWEAWERLNDREFEVMLLMMEGYTMRGMAEELGVKLKTAEMYRANLVRKFGMESRNELQVKVLEWRGWLFEQ